MINCEHKKYTVACASISQSVCGDCENYSNFMSHKDALSASKAREAALMEELAEQVRIGKDLVEHDVWRGDEMREYERQIDSLKQRAEAAKAQLKEISEAPVIFWIDPKDENIFEENIFESASVYVTKTSFDGNKTALIIRPTIKE